MKNVIMFGGASPIPKKRRHFKLSLPVSQLRCVVNSILSNCGQNAQHSTNPDRHRCLVK
jgi:hypothetical protein